MTAQLGAIVGYVDQLAELNTDDVEPMAHAVELTNVFRADEERPSLPVARRWPTHRIRTANSIWSRPCWESEH